MHNQETAALLNTVDAACLHEPLLNLTVCHHPAVPAQGRDHRWEAAAVQGLARLREQQLELQSSSRRWVCPACLLVDGLRVSAYPPLPQIACFAAHSLGAAAFPANHHQHPLLPVLPGACREGFVGLSASDTIRQCLRLGLKDQAQKLAREFKVRCA
jgi:hypothetical protein